MSASKIIINKFETIGDKFKSLHIIIEDEDSFNPDIKYSEWSDGKVIDKKKDPNKSSRLVVKIVSGSELDKLNLESSAKQIDDGVQFLPDPSLEHNKSHESYKSYNLNYNHNEKSLLFNHFNPNVINYKKDVSLHLFANNTENYMSPLEQSLKKVKENNTRIMENIHMLNRTLDYTKKKEILDMSFPKADRSFACDTCGKCFVYETGLRRHYSMRHALAEVTPRWQVVWTCIQCFQVWPHQDQALKHSNECCKTNIMESVREIKTSSLLQCEFCEKVYTNIPRLLWHTKVHTVANNYECNACTMSFVSYKMAEQHWMSCPWLQMYYNFSLPKLLLCNGCDRKFRNYEQLYNHRYKVGHFLAKSSSQSDIFTQDTLVYQCELCGQWFSSIEPLKLHKNQYHFNQEIGIHYKMDSTSNESQNNYYYNSFGNYNEDYLSTTT